MSNPQDQISNVQRLLQILPVVNRDTLFVLLQFLGLVAENSEDRKSEDGKSNNNLSLINSIHNL